eukprot:3937874-Rhodomonas_salina.1
MSLAISSDSAHSAMPRGTPILGTSEAFSSLIRARSLVAYFHTNPSSACTCTCDASVLPSTIIPMSPELRDVAASPVGFARAASGDRVTCWPAPHVGSSGSPPRKLTLCFGACLVAAAGGRSRSSMYRS